MHTRSDLRRLMIILLAVFCIEASARADVYDLPKVVAVQKRKYFLNDELAPQIAYLPLDALYKYLTLGVSYTHYFSDFAGWEVLNANYAFNQPTGLRDDIANSPVKIATRPQILEYYASSNIV